ncbi:hypothetical protein BU15DRAFT_82869 [Melanogaster broomeanus]|nr:hypothetical protein BU15DRAFT_82869 [Melanogaster broomeanus]
MPPDLPPPQPPLSPGSLSRPSPTVPGQGRSLPWLVALGALTTIPPGSVTLVLWKTTLPLWRTMTTSSCTISAQYSLPPLLCHLGHTITTTLHFDIASLYRPCYGIYNPQFTGNGLVVMENDNYVLAHPPGPASLTSTASSHP